MMTSCNHATITYLCTRLGSGGHRWYGCQDCGLVFEVAEHTMLSVEAAAALMPEDREARNQEAILRFRSRHAPKPPEPRAGAWAPLCLACSRSVAGDTHSCTRFRCEACASPATSVDGPHHRQDCPHFRASVAPSGTS